jgi:hypothetical protein
MEYRLGIPVEMGVHFRVSCSLTTVLRESTAGRARGKTYEIMWLVPLHSKLAILTHMRGSREVQTR